MEFLDPKKVLAELNLKEDFVAADFGSGSGGWALPLARNLKEGKVYAIDILEEPLSALKGRAKLERISNIETIKSDVEKTSRLFESSCDLVLMTNLLFETDEKKKVIAEAKRVLRPGGKILIVDWREDSPLGPPEKISVSEIREIAKEINLKFKKEFKAGTYHWALVFEKP